MVGQEPAFAGWKQVWQRTIQAGSFDVFCHFACSVQTGFWHNLLRLCRIGMLFDESCPVWRAFARGEMSGAQALMTGRCKAHGKVGLLLKMDKLFSRQPTPEELVARGWLEEGL